MTLTRKSGATRHKRALAPLKARESLAPFLELANVPLPEADNLEEIAVPAPLPEKLSARGPDRDPEDSVYDKLREFVGFMEAQKQGRAVRTKASTILCEELNRISPTIVQQLASEVSQLPEQSFALELYELRHAVRISLRAIVDLRSKGEDSASRHWQVPVALGFSVDPDGTITMRMGSLGLFESALRRVDANRIGACRCGKYFYAVRQEQTSCSTTCAHTERTRRWREKQPEYEYNRKLKKAGVEQIPNRQKELKA